VTEPLATEVHEADDGLEQHVTDRDPAQLLLELRAQLLLGGLGVLVGLAGFVRVIVGHRVASPQGAAIAAPAVA